MKTINFWRTLLFSSLAVLAFSACSDDDGDKDYSGVPEISVGGATAATVAHNLDEGATDAVAVVSTGAWTIAYASDADKTWVYPSAMSGKAGTSQLTFTVSQAPAGTDRSAIFTLTTAGSLLGYPLTATATVTVKQNGGGSTEVSTNVKAVRTAIAAIATTAGAEITENLTLTGIVISDVAAGGTGGNKSCYVVDNSTEAGAGIIVRFNSAYTFAAGQVITGSLTGSKATLYNNILQIAIASDASITAVEGATVDVAPIEVSDVNDLINYESQYVKVPNVQPTEAERGGTYYSGTSSYKTTAFETSTGASLDLSVYKTNSWAATTTIPSNSGYVCGIVSPYSGVGQVAPRNAADVAGLTEALFTVQVDYTTTTIAKITEAGSYKVNDAVVIATYQRGFVMNDGTASMLVFQYDKTAAPTPSVPAVGTKVSVQGTVSSYGGLLQFSVPTVTSAGTATVPTIAAETLTGAQMDALNAAPVVKKVKFTGTLAVSGNYYNVTVDGATVTGSLSYPDANLNASTFGGQVVDVEGWYIGYSGTGNIYFNVVATSVTANTTTPSVVFTDSKATFAATSPAEQTLAYTANAAAGTVTFDITGTDAGKFAVVSNTTTSVTVKAVGDNASTSAYAATLNAKSGTTVLASVALTQSAPASGNSVQLATADISKAGISAYGDVSITATDGSVWKGFLSGSSKNGYLQFGWNTDTTRDASKANLLSPELPSVAKSITITPEASTTTGRVFVLLPVDFQYTGQSANDVIAAAYAVSSATVKGSTEPITITIEGGKAGKQFMIRAVNGAVYVTNISIEY